MKLTKFIPLLVSTALLSACGGGGNSGVTPETRAATFSLENLFSKTQQENVPFTPQTATTVGDNPVGKLNWSVDDTKNWAISSEGVLTYIGELDFETLPNTHVVKVTAVDESGNLAMKSVTISLTDVDDGPSSDTNLTVNASNKLKTFTFQWDSVTGATSYQLCRKDTTKPNNCELLGSSTSSLTFDYTVPSLIDAQSHTFFVRPLNDFGSTLSNELKLSNSDFIAATSYLKASNTDLRDFFGASVSLSADGKTLAVGMLWDDSSTTGVNSTPNELLPNSGAVYVFTQEGDSWVQQAYIKSSNPNTRDFFGESIALSADGNTLAVGAYGEDSSTTGINSIPNEALSDSGAVYVFSRTGKTWSQQAYIKGSHTNQVTWKGDEFGKSVSLSADGNTLAVGAIGDDSSTTGVNSTPNESANDAGAVYIFTRTGTTWTEQSYIKASNTGQYDNFGLSVSLSADGTTLAVGAWNEDSGTTGINSTPNDSADNAGAAYVFIHNGVSWTQQAYIKASNSNEHDWFGESLSLSGNGNTLAVRASREDSSTTGINSIPNESANDAGAVYVFTRSGTTWTQQAYVKASNTGESDFFGYSLSLSHDGNMLAIAAYAEDSSSTGINSTTDNLTESAGAVYIFRRTGTTWEQKSYIKANNTGTYNLFGYAVSLSADSTTLAVGAARDTSSSTGINSLPSGYTESAGAVYVY